MEEMMKITEEMRIAAGESTAEREYWLNKLSGELSLSRFPIDFEDGNLQESRKDSLEFRIPEELRPAILKLSNDSDHRLFMILLSILNIVLFRYTESNDIIVGSTVGKQENEAEFINTLLPLRTTFNREAAYKELLSIVRTTFNEALENQNYPYAVLLDDLHLSGVGNHPALFDIALLLTNIQDRKYIRQVDCNMIFSFSDEGNAIPGMVEYNANLYEKETIARIISHYFKALEEVLSNLDIRVVDVDILTDSERRRLLFEFNSAAQTLDDLSETADTRIHQAFERQVERNPAHTALIFEDNILTYNGLNLRSNKLARLLRAKGVRPGTPVGLFFDRSLWMIAAMLAVLKAGAAYLPIDPAYPEDRIKYILFDSGVDRLLTHTRISPSRDFPPGIEIIAVDALAEDNAASDPGNLFNISKAADMIYTIYTSGSTGRPKGVILEQGAVEKMLYWRNKEYGLTAQDCALQLFSYAFDGFVTGFFTPLLSGSRIVMVNDNDILNPAALAHAIAKHKVTHFVAVPQLYREIIAGLTKEDSASLRVVVLAGDRLTHDIVEMSLDKNENIEISHEYGVTEAAVMSTILRHQEKCERISIGKPAVDTAVLILDRSDELQPIGAPGELCIAGSGLARGYLNKPELTAEKFASDGQGALFEKIAPCTPTKALIKSFWRSRNLFTKRFLVAEGDKLYKAGDLARWLGDGKIDFLGRIDNQVKVRGFRIETGEIESRLREHKDILEAVVIPREDEPGKKYLCAFLVMRNNQDKLKIPVIVDFLSQTLPTYMIPAFFIEIDKLPLTPHGKIDRKLLAKSDITDKIEMEYMPPRTELETKLSRIWQEVLDLDKVGIKDNYFNIGGDSIKSIRLISMINKNLDTKLGIVDLYQNETIEKLAALLTKNKNIESVEDENREVLKEIEEIKEKYLRRFVKNGN